MVLLGCFSGDEDEDDESGNECRDSPSEDGECEDEHGGALFVHERCESTVNVRMT